MTRGLAPLGPLLSDLLGRTEEDAPERGSFLAVASIGSAPAPAEAAADLPVTALLPRRPPKRGEPWDAYRDDTLRRLARWSRRLERMGLEAEPLVSGGALRFRAAPDQLEHLHTRAREIELLELDPLLEATLLDDVPAEIDLPPFRQAHPTLDGQGVTVAVLDTGVDLAHPHLDVAESHSECSEPVDVPGQHGTHCAGIIASRDDVFRGVAPAVRLVNVKVGDARHRVEPGALARGFDRAAAVGADILSVSIGFNHRPRTSSGGHGWACPARQPCLVCRAVDTAVRREAQLVVVAAGNEHEHAEAMRRAGQGARLDTELCCPGQARKAVTVAAIDKSTRLPAAFSSRGPASHGTTKPDVAAPGVNITSTIPVPRAADGRPRTPLARSDMFGRDSGTSMATPIVAGAAALLAQRLRERGQTVDPATLRRALRRSTAALPPFGVEAVGRGRVALRK